MTHLIQFYLSAIFHTYFEVRRHLLLLLSIMIEEGPAFKKSLVDSDEALAAEEEWYYQSVKRYVRHFSQVLPL